MPIQQSDDSQAKPPSAQRTTRELGRFLKYYKEKIRDYTADESVGVIRNIQRMLDNGITAEDIATALHNYAEDEYRKASHPTFTMSVRKFFSQAKIQEWITPVKRTPPMAYTKPSLPQVAFTPLERPQPVVPAMHNNTEEDDYEL